MNSDEDDDIKPVKNLLIYRKGKEILEVVYKIASLIPENDEYLNEVKACMLCDAAQLTVKVAGAEAAGLIFKIPMNYPAKILIRSSFR